MQNKVRLLYLINSFVMGGAEKAMVRILSGLDYKKYDSMAVSLQKRSEKLLPELEKAGIRIAKLSAVSKYDIRVAYELYKLIKEFVPDVLICSLFHSTILGRCVGRFSKIPVIINWEHNEDFGSVLRRFVNKSTISFSDKVFCDSQKVHAEVVKHLCPNKARLETISIGGVDLAQYYWNQTKKRSVVEVCTVGMLTKQKGFNYLVEAARSVLKNNSNVRFLIVGDGPESTNLQNQIDVLRLSGKVKLLGLRHGINEFFSKCDIYVQPSLWEGLCITVVEAMACGLPVVASNVGGIPESVIDGMSGFLVPPKDPWALANRISRLIKQPRLRFAMGKRGRQIAEHKYSVHKMCDKIERAVDDLVKTKIGLVWNPKIQAWQEQSSLNTIAFEKIDAVEQEMVMR